MTGSEIISTGFNSAMLALAWISLSVISIRHGISVVQLLVAARVFAKRIKPAARSNDLWSRYQDLAPPVSVIAPAFNEELSIVDSVKALLSLHYPEHEVIVVNDGSDDGTPTIASLQPMKKALSKHRQGFLFGLHGLLPHQKHGVAEEQLAVLPEGAEQRVVAQVHHRGAA